jgi:hypothetical protein
MTRRNKPADPTAENIADQTTQSAGGLTGGRAPEKERANEDARPPRDTDADDPAMPADDSTLNTKI